MYIADNLSRAFLPDQGEQDEEFQVFALEEESLNPCDSLTVSSETGTASKGNRARSSSSNSQDDSVDRMAWAEE